jgi:hypothetical protein
VRVTPQAGGPGTVARGSWNPRTNRVVARYTVTSRDAVRWGRFAMSCDMRLDTYRLGDARFRVLPAGGSDATVAGKDTSDRNDGSQFPNRIDTGLGGTADDGGQGGFDPTRLPLPAGVALTVLGAGLGFRHSVRNRR